MWGIQGLYKGPHSYNKYKSKVHYLQIDILEHKVRDLEQQLYSRDIKEKWQELLLLKSQYKQLTTERIVSNLLWLKQSYYDWGEKAGTLLAWRIKKIHTSTAINSIKLEDGKKT